jgi:hypothetical protein
MMEEEEECEVQAVEAASRESEWEWSWWDGEKDGASPLTGARRPGGEPGISGEQRTM